jgi:hypothetical protein
MHFIDTEKMKLNSDNYMKLLDNGLLPDSVEICTPGGLKRWDGATSHTSKVTQVHLVEEVPEFIKKDEWPPQCPIAILWIIMCMCGLSLRD